VRDTLAVAKALADENRLRVLCALGGRELCVCQITELLDLAPSTVSRHMSILRQARLVESRKEGRWVYYHAADEGSPEVARAALLWVRHSLRESPVVRSDTARLEEILQEDPVELCQRQNRS
jgi:DNA-binding transcriptional ArsR family regulator